MKRNHVRGMWLLRIRRINKGDHRKCAVCGAPLVVGEENCTMTTHERPYRFTKIRFTEVRCAECKKAGKHHTEHPEVS